VLTHRRPDASTTPGGRAAGLIPGLGLLAAVTAVATLAGRAVPAIGAPVLAIVTGVLIAAVRRPSDRLRPGIAVGAKPVLQASIVVLGTGLSLGEVAGTGVSSLPVLLGTLVIALGVAWLVGRGLGLATDVNVLVGVGTAICGASAIAAVDSVIDADRSDVSYAVATIFTFNVAAVLAFPPMGHALGLGQQGFGLWAGTAINDTSSVVAAATIYGHAATGYGVVVKLTRTLAIVPICIGLAWWRSRRVVAAAPSLPASPARRGPVRWDRILPRFIVGFLAAVTANSVGLVPAGWHHGLSDVAAVMITAALAAVGLSTSVSEVRRAGPRPLVLGAVLWIVVGATSLGLQGLFG
jgi:uncharacterized integral membrane protein (TIGR00698 family)